jgi:hypothetical protein
MSAPTLIIDILMVTAVVVITVWGIVLMQKGDW